MGSNRTRRALRALASFAALLAFVTAMTAVSVPAQAAEPIEIIFEDGFESGDLSAWDNVSTSRYGVTSDPARVKSGSYALEGTIPEGPGWGEINKWFMPCLLYTSDAADDLA